MQTRRSKATEPTVQHDKTPTPPPEPLPPPKERPKRTKDTLKITVRLALTLISATQSVRPYAAGYGKVGPAWSEVAAKVSEEAALDPPMTKKTAQRKIDDLVSLHKVIS
jgi:hypothetical protein